MADRVLHIGIDGRELAGQPTGVGRYLREVLRAWTLDTAFPHQMTVFVASAPTPDLQALGPRVNWFIAPADRPGTLWEQTRLPRAGREAGIDVLFAGGYTAPLRLGCPFVVAIYDVSFWAHPEWFSLREGMRRRWLTRQAALRAQRVITISEFSATEIVRWLRIPRDRVALAPPGAPNVPQATTRSPRSKTALFVGSLFTRRHIPELIEAFAVVAAREPDARLILVGDNRTMPPIDVSALAARHGVGAAVDWQRYLPDPQLEQMYDDARVFVFLSDYEGFAMTPLEALAHGVPAVLLDTPISREVYGDGAVRVPLDTAAIAAALSQLLTDDVEHQARVAAGQARLGRFSWTSTARVIQRALEDAARG